MRSKKGLVIVDLDNPYELPRFIQYSTQFEVADVQCSPFAIRAEWVASTNNNKALIFNLNMKTDATEAPIQYTLEGHDRQITDINFSAHHPDMLATCALDTRVCTWDLRTPNVATRLALPSVRQRSTHTFADFEAGATQVKWNRQNSNTLASSHDRYVQVWDVRHGARPVTTIHAHFNKVYGIDWHRSHPTRILTCSLDKTIKQWDQAGAAETVRQPSHTIYHGFPLLRARHTPFPNGIVAMPQVVGAPLALYKQPADNTFRPITSGSPDHVFRTDAIETRLHEFLWRSRGSTDNGIDNRDFQLVTWGADHRLRLHSVTPGILEQAVGFRKGSRVTEAPSTTRRGARYISFRDGPQVLPEADLEEEPPQQGNLAALFKNAVFKNQKHMQMQTGLSSLFKAEPKRVTMSAHKVRSSPAQRIMTQVTWMHNVNVTKRTFDGDGKLIDEKYEAGHSLAGEIKRADLKFPNVAFDTAELRFRQVVVAFKAPWGESYYPDPNSQTPARKLAFLRVKITFPEYYPGVEQELNDEGEVINQQAHPLRIAFEKTTAAIAPAMLDHLETAMEAIAEAYAVRAREALEAVLSYALGDRSLEDALNMAKEYDGRVPKAKPKTDAPDPEPDLGQSTDQKSSSEEEDDSDSGEFTNDLMHSSHSNANIPLPVQTTIRFSSLGSLVCVRLAQKPVTSSTGLMTDLIRLPRHLRQNPSKDDIFEAFGRIVAIHDSESPASSVVSWESSSSPSSSSGSDQETDIRFGNFLPPLPWQKPPRLHSKASLPSSTDAAHLNKKRSIVSILDSVVAQFIPSKRVLAEGYLVFGDGPAVCLHNSEVARRNGFDDLADIWQLCRLILNNEVPLEILPQQHRREQVLVLARRALVRIKRKDSGLDLQFDEAETVTNPKLRGRVKWGHNPVVTWLIPALFDHFERLADTQMLAMLSCVFSEPAAREGVTTTMAKTKHPHLSMEAPAFSLDYFASADAAWSLFKPTLSIPSTPAHSRYATPVNNEFGWHRLSRHLDTYGSHGSSNGPWGSDTLPSEPVTPYSTGNTPPTLSRAPTLRSATASHTPYSTSPEMSHTAVKKTSSGNFASAIATISNKFMSSSPPVKSRTDDLSTSAPTSGVTWGTTTFYSSGSNERGLGVAPRSKHGKRASFGQADRTIIDYISDSDSEYNDIGVTFDGGSEYTAPLTLGTEDGDDGSRIRVTLKNQDKFDDEACVSAPLLDMSKEWLYRAWREQYAEILGCWGLVSKRAEVLKFNGLVSYFPFEDVSRGGGSKAGSMHLALKKEGHDRVESELTVQPISRASTLAPPAATAAQFKRSPIASPRHFALNPEAVEFKPSSSFMLLDEVPAPPADVFIPAEQYLRLSIPTPAPSNDPFTDGAGESKLSPYTHLRPRPSLSRATSNISGHSASSRLQDTTASSPKKGKSEPIYSCSICWIRVSGRFYLCPACGHVAHFDCMDDELGMDEGECVVGCGCGCGFEDDYEHGSIVEYVEGVRGWEERGGWLPEVEFEEEASTKGSRMTLAQDMEYKEEVRRWDEQGKEGKEDGRRGEKKGKGKRKARVTGKSYY